MKLLARFVPRTHALPVTVHAACAAFGPHVFLLLQGQPAVLTISSSLTLSRVQKKADVLPIEYATMSRDFYVARSAQPLRLRIRVT